MTFEELGRVLDAYVERLNSVFSNIVEHFNECMAALVTPSPAVEARRLAEDAVEEGYTSVSRNNVHVGQDSGIVVCIYDDGDEYHYITTYDAEALSGDDT